MLSQGTLGRSDTIFSGSPGWLRGGNIVITAGTAAKFTAWYRANDGISVAGKTLSQWTQWAAANDQLPAAVCGLGVGVRLAEAGLREGSGGGEPVGGMTVTP